MTIQADLFASLRGASMLLLLFLLLFASLVVRQRLRVAVQPETSPR